MGGNAVHFDCFQSLNGRQLLQRILLSAADTAHARVDLQIDPAPREIDGLRRA
jgi:hypothetical protein